MNCKNFFVDSELELPYNRQHGQNEILQGAKISVKDYQYNYNLFFSGKCISYFHSEFFPEKYQTLKYNFFTFNFVKKLIFLYLWK